MHNQAPVQENDTVAKGLLKGLEDFKVGGRLESNNSIIENGQNTEKSPGDLRRLTVISISSEKPSAYTDVKTSNE